LAVKGSPSRKLFAPSIRLDSAIDKVNSDVAGHERYYWETDAENSRDIFFEKEWP